MTSRVARVAAVLLMVGGIAVASGCDGKTVETPTAPTPPPPPPPPPPAIEAPTQGPSGLTFAAASSTTVTLSWTNGNGEGRIVLAREGMDVDGSPADGTTYLADPRFGRGEEVGSGNFVVFRAGESSVEVTELTPGADYYFAVYEYNGMGADTKYQRGERAAGERQTEARASALVGAWLWGSAGDKWSAVLTVLDDTTYMIVDDGFADDGGGPGAEWGFYTWNATSGTLTADPMTDTSGDWGLSDPAGKVARITDDVMTFTIGGDVETLRRVRRSETNPLVGSWVQFDYAPPPQLLVITFIDSEHPVLVVHESDDQQLRRRVVVEQHPGSYEGVCFGAPNAT